ncbi:MAG TPA: hypothetical protein VL309_10775 [Vicinamibacterales bacterium]|jgi:hypothetical protein|nr:hypothetical protein [Vicinamibacterales bacterium]
MTQVKSGVGGWLAVLCGVLLVWQPLSFGLLASAELDSVMRRGLPAAAVLAARLIVTALGVAAGLALLSRRPAAVALARLSLVCSAAADLFVYTTPYFPNNRAPGETPLFVGASLAWYGLWLAYLARSRRVRLTY